jgi:transcriptional regulator with XRE-family HTH domain
MPLSKYYTRQRCEKYYRGGFRGALYRLVRAKVGISQATMAGLLGIKRENLIYREHMKQYYTLQELHALQQLSGLTWSELGELIDAIVKRR